MKKLLIHNQETIISDSALFPIEEQYVFQLDDDTPGPDEFITKALTETDLSEKILKSEIIFIRLSLSPNYLEYLGLRLAYQIRLSFKLGNNNRLPIIIVCEESFQFVGLTTNIPDILFTDGLYFMKDTKQDFARYDKMFLEGKLPGLKSEKDFVQAIRIPAPSNYSSRHSIANEWCIIRWAEMGKNFSNELRDELKCSNTNADSLYFQYLEKKYKFDSERDNRQNYKKDDNRENLIIPYQSGSKIYYIDDEAGKGWGKLFRDGIFKEYSDIGSFDFFKGFKKNINKDILLSEIKTELPRLINDQGFNVFIIDLRLFDTDFKKGSEPSGFNLIEEIQKINPGVQIIVFTASKNADNMQKAVDLNVSGYVIKESPENILTRSESWNVFLKFMNSVRKAAKFHYLKEVYSATQALRNSPMFAKLTNGKHLEFKTATIGKGGFLDKIFALLSAKDDLLLGSAFLSCFAMIEKFCDIFYSSPVRDKGIVATFTGDFTHYQKLNENETLSSMSYQRGNLGYEVSPNEKTFVAISCKATATLRTNKITLGDTEGTSKLLAVLSYRFSISSVDLNKMLEMAFLRNHIAAHNTGKINTDKRKIMIADILFILKINQQIFDIQNKTY